MKRQYSGNAHGLVRGIGIVNWVHTYKDDYHPLDFRIYSPDSDGKTKNDHFRDMLQQAFEEKGIKAQTILFDCWYAASENLKYIHRLDKFFVTTLKENRRVSLSKNKVIFVYNRLSRRTNNSNTVWPLNLKKSHLKCSFSR